MIKHKEKCQQTNVHVWERIICKYKNEQEELINKMLKENRIEFISGAQRMESI